MTQIPEMLLNDLDPELNKVTGDIVDACFEVYRQLGAGLVESVYRQSLAEELRLRGHLVEQKVAVPVVYKGVQVSDPLEIDILVDDMVVVETKSVIDFHPVFFNQLKTYLRLTGRKVGILVNFNATRLRDNVFRVVDSPTPPPSEAPRV